MSVALFFGSITFIDIAHLSSVFRMLEVINVECPKQILDKDPEFVKCMVLMTHDTLKEVVFNTMDTSVAACDPDSNWMGVLIQDRGEGMCRYTGTAGRFRRCIRLGCSQWSFFQMRTDV